MVEGEVLEVEEKIISIVITVSVITTQHSHFPLRASFLEFHNMCAGVILKECQEHF